MLWLGVFVMTLDVLVAATVTDTAARSTCGCNRFKSVARLIGPSGKACEWELASINVKNLFSRGYSHNCTLF